MRTSPRYSSSSIAVSRRSFLRGAGACLALPFFESLVRASAPKVSARRFVCIANPFGMIHDAFFPAEAGMAAALPENLRPLEGQRGKFTVFSNVDHGHNTGHGATHAFLSGVLTSELGAMPEGNITLDQFLGRHSAGATRFPVLNTAAGPVGGGGVELSWTKNGVMVPPLQQVTRVFQMLFVDDPEDRQAQRARLYQEQGSILDSVNAQARAMERRLDPHDRQKLDQYFASIREVEKAIEQEKAWLTRPRPSVEMKEPRNGTVSQQLPILLDLVALALQTDSTRVATIEVPGSFDTAAMGIEEKGYHGYSHHGKDPKLMAGMRKVENYQVAQLARFMARLSDFGILDETQILFGSGMSDGSAHTNRKLPVLLAGGGYRHQTHLVLPEEAKGRVPLCNLYLTMAQRFGVETSAFGTSKGTLSGI